MAGLRARSSRRERLREDRAHLGRGDFRGEHTRTLASLDQRHLGLGIIYGLCGTWERTVHCLKRLARVTVALEFQDIARTRGPGADGLLRRTPPMGGDLGAFEAMPSSCVCSIACLQVAARR